MRRLIAWWVGLAGGLALLGCGDSADLKGYAEPKRVAERTEFYLNGLKKQLAKPDYDPVNDPAISVSAELITQSLPSAIQTKVTNESTKQEALAKCEQLKKVFAEKVRAPIDAEPRDLNAAGTGTDECLEIARQVTKLLGG